MWRLADRVGSIGASPLVALSARIAALRAAGKDVLDLGIGEPDFDTPIPVKQAGVAAIEAGATKYTAMAGTATLRSAIARKFKLENGLNYAEDQIIVSCGVKQVIFNAFMATLEPGNEVIIPAPFWMSYPSIVRLAGGCPVIVPCEPRKGFKLTASALEKAISPRTKWLILNSPNNPSGAVYSKNELQELAEVLLRYHHVAVLSDDVYEHIRFDGSSFSTIANIEPRLFDRTLTANGVSKAFAMTGWRLGYAGADKELIRGMIEVQAQSTSAPSSISQAAALAALSGSHDEVFRRNETFFERRNGVIEYFSGAPFLELIPPQGAFYAFVGCQSIIGCRSLSGRSLNNDLEIASWLLDEEHVATLPGTAFGMSPYIRLSFATSLETLKKACGRIIRACATLRP